MTKENVQMYPAKQIERGKLMKILRTVLVLFATLLVLSNFSTTQAQVEENTIFLPIIMNNYKVRNETVYVREATVQRVSRKISFGITMFDSWMGIVHNDSSQTKKYIQVEILYYNSSDQLIGRQLQSIIGIIPPDGERCFNFNIDSQVSARFTKASFHIFSFSDEDSRKYRSPTVEFYSKNITNYGFIGNDKIFQYQGTIHNSYPENLNQTVVSVTGFDNFGKVVECVNQYFSFDRSFSDQYYFFSIDGLAAPETISNTIIDVSGSVDPFYLWSPIN